MVSVATAQKKGEGYITGKMVTTGGEAMSGWRIRFFDTAGPSPFTHEYWRVPDYIVRSADDGSFSARLPEGTYYMETINKVDEKKFSPPEEGYLIYPPMDAGETKTYRVKAGETTNIGLISGAVPFKKEWAARGKTGIEGVVLDMQGNPVERVLVFASHTPTMDDPLFVSDRETGTDGKYVLRVPERGQYYLSVHLTIMGEKPIAVTVNTGEMTKGVDLRFTRRGTQ